MKSNNGWTTNFLSDLSESIKYGHTASATEKDTGNKFLRITDIQDGFVNWKSVPFCECSENENNKYELSKGDIVFARTGATTGKSFLIEECPPKTVFASYLIRVRPNKKIYPKYLYQFFQTANYWGQVSASSSGTAQEGVNATKLSNLKIPLPPLPEQKRIAEVLDKADALREKRRLALQKLDTLLQSVFLEMFGDPVKNPMGWDLIPLNKLLRKPLQNGAYFPKEQYTEIEDESVEMIHMSDAFYGIVKRGNLKRVKASDSEIEKYQVTSNDLLVARRSLNYEGSVNPCLIPKSENDLIFESSMIKISPNFSKLSLFYLYAFLKNERSRMTYVFPYVTKSTISGINQTNLAKVNIIVPDIEKQKEFENVFSKIEMMKENNIKNSQVTENLFQSLQQKAFKGELFEKDGREEIEEASAG